MNNSQFPAARKSGLVVQEMPDEVLVYDLNTNKAHCLNQTAAKVWMACDGKTPVSEIAKHFGSGANEDLVWLAIDQLSENDLLEREVVTKFKGQSRREVIKKIGLASIIAVPVIASLVAPQNALAAASCACVNPGDCGPGSPNYTHCPTDMCSGVGVCNA
ncbi:MAG TPA: PqqD family protein [Pyrinomonadaceae bacterium]|nr:PqqD family protein [Pyrinomonadaceae bacterium]